MHLTKDAILLSLVVVPLANLLLPVGFRAQTGKPARRLDPESYVGECELFVYYNLVGDGPSQLHRCRTAIIKENP